MNSFMNELIDQNNIGLTENMATKRITTKSAVLDLFALGGAYRNRSDEDCIVAFKNAYNENPDLAMKCLFYLRDVRGGQGERRFFRVCFRWLANSHPTSAKKNLKNVPEYGRIDDLYCLVDTPLEKEMFNYIKHLTVIAINEYEELEKDDKI